MTHECYHSYEKSLVELYDSADDEHKDLMTLNRVKQYKEEFSNYHSGGGEEYYGQAVEEDAREYSDTAAESHRNLIINHLTNYE